MVRKKQEETFRERFMKEEGKKIKEKESLGDVWLSGVNIALSTPENL